MNNFSIITAIFLLVFAAFAAESNAADYELARVRSDGKVIDSQGNVTGIKNKSDPRNTKYEYYYYSIDEDGNLSEESSFKIMSHPENLGAGYVKVPLKSEAPVANGGYRSTSSAHRNEFVTEY
ncbi:MAG: hypothetical protein COV36_06125 [Alphaproteobacteria bacterium CG11_big_fil_rev_8_21_14_0_20_44_7]|nr:MAG: hypothetical protein COV36_06125 [Alphaproteobacteria bacterium CG11_big_fil_rev_8_21_14_0_20_44_7]